MNQDGPMLLIATDSLQEGGGGANSPLRLCSEEVSSTKPASLVLYNLLWFNGDK